MNSNSINDEKLIEIIKNDFAQGARIFVERYSEFLRNRAVTFGLNDFDLEELLSDVLLNALLQIQEGKYNYEGKEKLKGWLYLSLRNRCRDFFEKVKIQGEKVKILRYDETELEDFNDDLKLDQGTIAVNKIIIQSFDENVKEDERKKIVIETLKEFPVEEQSYIYCYFNGITLKEMAEMSKCTVDAIKKRVTRTFQEYCEKIANKLNKNSVEIYERIKEIHKADIKGRITGR